MARWKFLVIARQVTPYVELLDRYGVDAYDRWWGYG
jgi:hypothetical protein